MQITKEEMLRKIEIYKKNSKALCDILALYSRCMEKGTPTIPGYTTYSCEVNRQNSAVLLSYAALEEVIRDLEDPDVTVPLEAENIESLFLEDEKKRLEIYDELKETEYFAELEKELTKNYRLGETMRYFTLLEADNKFNTKKTKFNFLERLCGYSLDFVSEFLCSNIDIEEKTVMFYNIVSHCIQFEFPDTLEKILDTYGAGADLSRTRYSEKEAKIQELIAAFKVKMDKEEKAKQKLFTIIRSHYHVRGLSDYWLTFLQTRGIVDFTDLRDPATICNKDEEISVCASINTEYLNNFEKFYQLEDYQKIPEKIRRNDDIIILSEIMICDLAKFISLNSYQTSLEDIDVIAARVMANQIAERCSNDKLIADIKSAILHKAKNKEEYKTYCELVHIFETKVDYDAYVRQAREERALKARKQLEEKNQLIEARYELFRRLYNLNESLQEQVPSRKVIKNLAFPKNK